MKRWTERPLDTAADELDGRIGALLRQAPSPPPLSPGQLAQVAARLRQPGARRPRFLRWALPTVLVLASSAVYARQEIAGVVSQVAEKLGMRSAPKPTAPVLGRAPMVRAEETAAAATGRQQTTTSQETTTPVNTPGRAAKAITNRQRRQPGRPAPRLALVPRPAASPASPAPPTTTPALYPPTPAAPAPLPAAEPGPHAPHSSWAPPPADYLPPRPAPLAVPPPVAVLPPPPASTLGSEAQLLARALASLRTDGDPRAALRHLDEHRNRFPRGLLAPDARLLRVDALLGARREAEALALLESLPLDGSPRGLELQLVRGELRASRSCRRAREDFDSLLRRSLPPALAERAWRGRAICRLRESAASGSREHAGLDTPARTELEAYLARFPQGPFAAEARARLRAP